MFIVLEFEEFKSHNISRRRRVGGNEGGATGQWTRLFLKVASHLNAVQIMFENIFRLLRARLS